MKQRITPGARVRTVGLTVSKKMSKTSKQALTTPLGQPQFFVVVIDDEGSHKAFTGYRTALSAAKAVASLYDGVDAEDFARTWNASDASGGTRFEIGEES